MDDNSALLKQCKGPCQRTLPATTDYFNSVGKGYLHSLCKECRGLQRKQYRQEHREEFAKAYQNRTETQIEAQRKRKWEQNQRDKERRRAGKEALAATHPGERWCPRCEKWKPATREFFYPQADKKSGWMSHCKECQSAHRVERKPAMKVWRQANAERLAEQERQYRKSEHGKEIYRLRTERYRERRRYIDKVWRNAHRDHVNARNRALRLRRRDYYNRLARKWYAAHREQVSRTAKRWRNSHQEHIKQYRRSHREQMQAYINRRRVRLMSIPGTHTPAEIQEQLKRQRYRCYYAACGYSKFQRVKGKYVYHIDHTIPLSRREAGPRNDISHLVLACPTCNMKKGNKLPHEWFEGGRLL